jgi:hypothetical protein
MANVKRSTIEFNRANSWQQNKQNRSSGIDALGFSLITI